MEKHHEIQEVCRATFLTKDKMTGFIWVAVLLLLSAMTWALTVESRQASMSKDVSNLETMDKKLDVIIKELKN